MMRYLLWMVLPILFSSSLVHASMPEKVNNLIKAHKIQHNQVSVLIANAKTGKPLVSINADRSRVPASVMKILTTYSALLKFGSNYRWPTKFYYHGRYRQGIIEGDLIVKPYGDPTLSCRDIPRIVANLKKMRITSITGDVHIDRSFFSVENRVSSGFDQNRHSEYNAMPDAMMFDDHLCKITIASRNGEMRINKGHPDPSYTIVNKLKTSPKSCEGDRTWPRMKIVTKDLHPTVIFSGTMSQHCSPRTIRKVLNHPYYSFYYALVAEFKHANIAYRGELKLTKVPSGSHALFTHYSRTLDRIIGKTNKKSNNLYARHLLLLLGAEQMGAPATEAKGQKAVTHILKSQGLLRRGTMRIDNGSGLSRDSRISAKTLSEILYAAQKRYGKRWMQMLSIAGVDGTIQSRFRYKAAKGRAWMKTGTLRNVKNIAGYVRARSSGTLYSVVILYNGAERWKGSSLQNDIINWLAG